MNGRNVIENPLTESPQGYQFDFAQLESCFRQHTPPLLLLCNPHKPTGRCWTHDELTQLMTLCRAHGVTVISAEIWADLLLPGHAFTSVLHLDKDCLEHVIAATAASGFAPITPDSSTLLFRSAGVADIPLGSDTPARCAGGFHCNV